MSIIVPPVFIAIILTAFTKSKKLAVITILIIAVAAFSGCFKNYFKVNSKPATDSATLAALKDSDKYFVIHLKNGFYALKNISANGNMMEGDLQKLPPEREKFVYKSQARSLLFSEVHLYAQNETATDTSHILIPLKSVSKINIFERDSGRTIGSYVLGGLGIYFGSGLLALIVVLIACNLSAGVHIRRQSI